PCAKHRYRWLALEHPTRLLLLFYPLREIGKAVSLWINSTLKGANTNLIIITRIYNNHIRATMSEFHFCGGTYSPTHSAVRNSGTPRVTISFLRRTFRRYKGACSLLASLCLCFVKRGSERRLYYTSFTSFGLLIIVLVNLYVS